MTILITQYPPAECVGVAFSDTLLVFRDANANGKRDLNENLIGSGKITEDIRASGALGKWDGSKIVWGSNAAPSVDVEAVKRLLAQIEGNANGMANDAAFRKGEITQLAAELRRLL